MASCHTTSLSSNLASFARPPGAAPYVDGLALSVEASRDGASLVAGFDCVGSRVCGFGSSDDCGAWLSASATRPSVRVAVFKILVPRFTGIISRLPADAELQLDRKLRQSRAQKTRIMGAVLPHRHRMESTHSKMSAPRIARAPTLRQNGGHANESVLRHAAAAQGHLTLVQHLAQNGGGVVGQSLGHGQE